MQKITLPHVDTEFIVKNGPGFVYWKNIDSVYIGCNQNFATLIGMEVPDDVIGLHESEMPWATITPDTVKHNIDADSKVLKSKERVITEESIGIKNQNGLSIILRSEKLPLIDKNGIIVGILGVSVDITDTKEKERLLIEEAKIRQIMDVVDTSIYWKDTNGYMQDCNQYVLDMFGAQRKEDVIGKNEYDLLTKEEAIQIGKIDKLVLENGSYRGEEIFVVANGVEKVYYTVKNQLLDKQGKVMGIVGTSIDITAQKKAEKLVVEQQENFRKIVHQTVHDIRSPLTAMHMILPLCNTLPEKLRTSLSKAAVRMLDIANELLNKVKLEEDIKDESCHQTLILAELLEVITEKKYEYRHLSLNFTSRINQSGYFAFININAKAFKRSLSNLINNAVEALDGNAEKITIYLDTMDDKVRIIIEDSGKGMTEARKDKILNNIVVTSGKSYGKGLGFSQIREALENNNGILNIESEVGIGTKVILTFPKIENPKWMVEKIELDNDTLVIILDDDESIHGAWEARFKKSAPHLERRHFKDGNEAVLYINNLNAIEKNKVFLLTDYELLQQNLNGLDVISQTEIKNSILVTSHHNTQEVRELATLSNTRILPKPLAPEVPITVNPDF